MDFPAVETLSPGHSLSLHDLYPPVIRGAAVGKMNLCHIHDEQSAGEWNMRMEMIDTPERKSHQPVQEYFHSRCALEKG